MQRSRFDIANTHSAAGTAFLLPTQPSRGRRVLWSGPGLLHPETVAEAWGSRGSTGVRTITGPWAIAAWDPTAHAHALIADPVGVQPLYWARTAGGGIVASSVLSALVDRDDVDASLDYEGVLLDALYELHGASTRTSFRSVRRVPGGHRLMVRSDGTTKLERYWDPADLPGPDESLTLGDCADLLRERIEAAVRRATPAEVPVGAHVSGGLDCTSVACCAHQALREKGRGIVAGYSWAPSAAVEPRFPGDERELLDDVEAAEGFPIRTIGVDGADDWFWDLDPVRYPNVAHERERHVLGTAKRDGVAVLLSGWGGDELASFNGRAVLPSLMARGQVRRVWRELAAVDTIRGRRPALRTRIRRLASTAWATLPGSLRAALRPAAQSSHQAEFEAALRAYSPWAADLFEADRRTFAGARNHHAMQLALLRSGHLQHRIAAWHQTGSLLGVQYRYPLLDLDVVAAALRLPSWAFLSQGWDRPAFRLAIEPRVPPSVAWNIAKFEPSLHWSPNGGVDVDALVRRRRHLDDPEYEAVMELATWSNLGDGRRLPSHLRVTSRPDLALRG